MTESAARRIALVINPNAGAGRGRRVADRALARLRARGADVAEYVGHDPAETRRLLAEAVGSDADVVAVVGGDGMISLALQVIAGGETGGAMPLGVIPAGTGNDHARAYGIPRGDPAAAADVLLDGDVRRVDLGWIVTADGDTRWFGTIAAAGFDSFVTERTNRMRWPRGRMRYYLALVAELARLRPVPLRLVLDGDTIVEQPMILVAVGNTRSYGGGMQICPAADPADGQLDVTLIGAASLARLIALFPRIVRGRHAGRPPVRTFRCRTVGLDSPSITAYADGEPVGPLPIELGVTPARLGIVVPRAAESRTAE